jgi:hypothetical protein
VWCVGVVFETEREYRVKERDVKIECPHELWTESQKQGEIEGDWEGQQVHRLCACNDRSKKSVTKMCTEVASVGP